MTTFTLASLTVALIVTPAACWLGLVWATARRGLIATRRLQGLAGYQKAEGGRWIFVAHHGKLQAARRVAEELAADGIEVSVKA